MKRENITRLCRKTLLRENMRKGDASLNKLQICFYDLLQCIESLRYKADPKHLRKKTVPGNLLFPKKIQGIQKSATNLVAYPSNN